MATEDAKCNWMATLDSGTAFLSQSHLSFLLNFLLSALKDTWYRSLFQRYAKWPCWTGSDSLWAAHLRWRLSTVRPWRSNPFLPTSSTGVDVSFFFSRGFMLVCVQNTLRRMPKMTMGAMKDCCSKPQVGQTVRRSSMKVSMSPFDERHTTSSSLSNGRVGLVFFRA